MSFSTEDRPASTESGTGDVVRHVTSFMKKRMTDVKERLEQHRQTSYSQIENQRMEREREAIEWATVFEREEAQRAQEIQEMLERLKREQRELDKLAAAELHVFAEQQVHLRHAQEAEKKELAEQAKTAQEQAERQREVERERQERLAADAHNRLVDEQRQAAAQTIQSQALFDRQKQALYASEEATREMQSFSQTLQQMEQRLYPYLNDATPAAKQLRMTMKMRIHRRVQQISATKEQVEHVANDLVQLLTETKGKGDAFLYVVDVMCLNFVEQGDTQVHVHQSSSYAVGMTVVKVLQRYPEMVNVLMGHFLKKCPYVLPKYIARDASMSDEVYRRSQGFIMAIDGTWETEESYHERMAGVVALYAAILQTASPNTQLPHPRGIEHAWTWLARLCNLPPRRVTPAILLPFLQVAGPVLYRNYPRQLIKLTHFILNVFLPKVPEGCTGSKTRLEMFLRDVLKRGTYVLPEGYLA